MPIVQAPVAAQNLDAAIARSRLGWIAFLLVLNLGATGYLAASAWRSRIEAREVAQRHDRWEYTMQFRRDSEASPTLDVWMTNLGEQGWEAYSVRRASEGDDADNRPRWGTEVMLRRRSSPIAE